MMVSCGCKRVVLLVPTLLLTSWLITTRQPIEAIPGVSRGSLSVGKARAHSDLRPEAIANFGWRDVRRVIQHMAGHRVDNSISSDRTSSRATRHFVPLESYPKAVCLDGTPAVVYIRRTKSAKWFLFLEGWGFCSSLTDCLHRASTPHGSSAWDLPVRDMNAGDGPYFSTDPIENPLLHDWNWVFIRYCDGGYLSGDVAEPVTVETVDSEASDHQPSKIYFRGRYIREAVVDLLRAHHGMDSATDVILSGCSSGAITTLFSINVWHKLLHWIPNVLALADSGYYLDINGTTSAPKEFIYERQNTSASLVPECARQNADKPWVCFIASNHIRYASTRVFIWQSRYDTDQLGGICETDAKACINEYGANLQASILANMAEQSYFIDGCYRHCSPWSVAKRASGTTQLRALNHWYHNGKVQIVQVGTYPCDGCCLANYTDTTVLIK